MNENGDRVHSEGEDSQDYAEFIRELLQAEQDSDSDIKVIYPILAGGSISSMPVLPRLYSK